MSNYNPKSESQRNAFDSLVALVKKFVPPNTFEGELYDAVDFVITAARRCIAGGEAELISSKALLEDYFGTLLKRDFGEFIELTRKLTDYVSELHGPNASASAFAQSSSVKSAAPVFVQDSSDSDSDSSSASSSTDASDSDEEEGGSSKKTGAGRGRANKKRRTEAGADASFPNNAGGANGDGEDTALGGVKRVKLHQTSKPHFIRDTRLRALFPADSEAERTAKAENILKFLSREGEEDITVQSQLTSYFHRFANTNSNASGSGAFGGLVGGVYDMSEEIDAEVDFLITNRWVIVYGVREFAAVSAASAALTAGGGSSSASALEEATKKARTDVMDAMKAHALRDRNVADIYRDHTGINVFEGNAAAAAALFPSGGGAFRPLDILDLEGLHRQGEKTTYDASSKRVKVPNGTRRGTYETHDEIILPQTGTYGNSGKKHKKPVVELKIEEAFPKWAQRGFDIAKTRALNPVQSRVHPVAFKSDDNMLVSAPTGAGKTLVALMTILRVLDNYKADNFGSEFHKDDFKIVYIAPMKALVQEVVQTFSARLEPFGITVAELSGDSGLSQQQLSETQMIVATPEKWDIVTRKSAELSVSNFVRLIIIDEIHLLHNDRGPILESIISRMVLQQQRTQTHCRLVGLSATLPNAEDVSRFMKVDATRGFFEFDASDRPVPLQQTYCGIKKIPNKRHAEVLNMVTYTKTMQFEGQSVMVFVHSRKDTAYTALYLMNRAIKENQIGMLGVDVAGNRRLVEEAGAELREELKDLIPNGFAIHHAGMSAFERRTVEDLFMQKRVKVLVCTSTLAWGVNLPTHAVIIKGTQIYSPQHKGTTYLSSLDVLQMFGRAGRKGFDTFGEACIITTPDDVYYYLSILTEQMPIESQFVNHLVNALNAEVVLGNVLSIADGAAWLQHTYHYIRSKKCPKQYGTEVTRSDPDLLCFRESLIHSAALALAECRMVEYDEDMRTFKPTPLGRIASTYYIHHSSMKVYNSMLKATSQEIDLFHIFSQSSEFKQITVRSDEQEELKKLVELCPVPVKEIGRHGIPNSSAKINVLLQCYITGANLKGMALMTEMVYIKDSAQRILRAMYDMCVVRDFGETSRKVHAIYQSVLRHQWPMQCPLRQIMPEIRNSVTTHSANPILVKNQMVELRDCIRFAEARKNFFYSHYRQYSFKTLLEAVFKHDERQASSFHSFLKKIPRIIVDVTTLPVSNTVLKMDISIRLDVDYDPIVHDPASAEMVISVEDATLLSSSAGGGAASWAGTKSGGAGSCKKTILFHEVVDAGKLIKHQKLSDSEDGGDDSDNATGAGAAHGEDEDDDGGMATDTPSFETSVLVPVPADNKPVYYYVHAMLSSWVGSAVTVPVPLVGLAMPPPPPPPTPLEAFAKKIREQQELRRLAKIEQRRIRIEEAASGGNSDDLMGDNGIDMVDADDDDEDVNGGAISVASAVGEDLAGVAAELFPFETLSVSQAAAAETILSTGDAADTPRDDAHWVSNVYVGMPAGTGKTFLAELVVLRLLKENALGLSSPAPSPNAENEEEEAASPSYKHLLYLTPTEQQAARRFSEWHEKYGVALEQSVILLTGNTVKDLKTISEAVALGEGADPKTAIIIASAANAAALVQRGANLLRSVRYVVLDHLHQLGTTIGGVYETVVSRLLAKPYMTNDGAAARVVGLSYPVVYPQAMAEWLRAGKSGRNFTFDNKLTRRLTVRVEGSLVPGARSRLEFQRLAALKELSTRREYADGTTVVFAPNAQEALRTARQLIDLRRRLNLKIGGKGDAAANNNSNSHDTYGDDTDQATGVSVVRVVGGVSGQLNPSDEAIDLITNEALRTMLQKHRTAFIGPNISMDDFKLLLKVLSLAELPIVLFASRDDAWRLPAALFHNGIVIAAEKLPASASASSSSTTVDTPPQQQSVFDCSAVEMVQMTSRVDRLCAVFCRQPRKWYWESMLTDAARIPVTSVVSSASDYEGPFNNRIAEGSIATLGQCLTVFQTHYFYHYLKVNPAYYGLPSSDKSVLRKVLSDMCEQACQQLNEAGCILYSEDSATVAPTNVGLAAAKQCVSIDTVRTLMLVAGSQLEYEREEYEKALKHSTSANANSSETLLLGHKDSIVRSLVQLLCNLDEVTSLPCAQLSASGERRLLVRVAQDLPALAPIRTELTLTTAADKALVLIMMCLARTEYDFMRNLPLYNVRKNNNTNNRTDNADLESAATDAVAAEDDLVVATQLLKDAEEILARVEHLAMAAVDITGRQSFSTARSFVDVSACLATRAMPSLIVKTRHLAQIPESLLPGALLTSWADEVRKGGAPSQPLYPISVADAAAGSPALAAVLSRELLSGNSGEAYGMSEEEVAERKAVVTTAIHAIADHARLVSAIVGPDNIGQQQQQQKAIPHVFTAETVALNAKAGIIMQNEVLQLQVEVSFNNFIAPIASSSSSSSSVVVWAICFDANNTSKPLLGLQPIRVRGVNSVGATSAPQLVTAQLVMPLPEQSEEEDTNEVDLKVMLIPQNIVMLGADGAARGGVVAGVVVEEGEDEEENE